jgi:outer membrane receptor protein involved in Fe transport
MNPIRRLAAALAGLRSALLAFAAVAPAAFAQSFPSPQPGQVAVLGPTAPGTRPSQKSARSSSEACPAGRSP